MSPAPKKVYKPPAQRVLTFVEHSHCLDYFCDCKIHVGEAFLVDFGRENYRVVCRIGKQELCETHHDFNHENFMRIPCKRMINM